MKTHRAFFALALAVAGLPSLARCQATLSDVSSSTVQLGSRDYYRVTATMNGPGGGSYRVPIELFYPAVPAERNGAAIVDLLNNTAMRLRAADTGGAEFNAPTPIARVLLGDAFIGSHGYTYVGIQWDHEMIPFINFHTGTNYAIPSAADEFEITFDVARLLRQPPAALPGALAPVPARIAFGYSSSSAIPQTMMEHPVLRSAFSVLYSGLMLGGVGKQIAGSVHGSPSSGSGAFGVGDLKIMIVNTETDPELLEADLLRGQSAGYRYYEIAGASHNPTNLVPMDTFLGLPGMSATHRQNPLGIGPVCRSMMEHLRNWVAGNGTPPDSVALGTTFNTQSNVDFTPALPGKEKVRDVPRSSSDGNASGGIRLPPFVAPIGRHNGLETDPGMAYSATTLGQMLSGAFQVYGATELAARYPSHASYVQAVTAAADAALAAGWILAVDRDAYVATAQASAVGNGAPLTDEQILDCFGL